VGSVSDFRVIRSLNPTLDQIALATGRLWRFAPGARMGVPVAFIVTMDLTFNLNR
jgi:TonB family protein